jgi:exoribonuclease-2
VRVQRARVRNYAKLAYNSVDAWLQGTAAIPQAMAEADGRSGTGSHAGRRWRSDSENGGTKTGALDLETIEPRAIVENGRVVGLQHEKKNRARALIEDFMIAANGVTARYLEAKGLPRSTCRTFA